MYQYPAKTISAMHYLIAVVWLLSSFTTDTAYCETHSPTRTFSFHSSANKNTDHNTQSAVLQVGSTFRSLKTELPYDKYINRPLASHENFSFTQSGSDQPRADLLVIFKLALEEFNLLSGLRLYWDHTESYIEELAIKLKLKGEISISDSHFHPDGQAAKETRRSKGYASGQRHNSTGMLSLFTPQKLKWNLGMNPDDLSVFFDLNVNSHLSFSGEFGNESQVGLYLEFPF